MEAKFLSFIFLFASAFSVAQNKPATVKEYKKVFTTYPFSDPDPIPKPEAKIYPYYRFDSFTDKPIQKEWKVVELENDYIKLMILPEIGGKIWSATEKSTGKDFIYYNHVVKFRDVAMRGPWTSGGIEANYGIIGHTPNCATPVDFTTIKREDGSVSCVIGVLDLLTRTCWRLDINLPKDKAYVTTTSFWYNPSPLEQPYYTWMNTGIKAGGNLQFVYPGKNYLGHEGEYGDWPVNKTNGKDVSLYNNNNFGGYKSYHVFGKYTDFFGGYWLDDDFGMARFSSHDDKAGKKIWIWGLSQQGMIWEKLLTDSDGQYVEVQSGRLFNQSAESSMYTPFKHRSFAPGQSDTWTEYWFPVKQTRGFVKANNYGAVNIKQEKEWLKIYFSPLQNLNETMEVFHDGKSIYTRQVTLHPMETFVDSIRGVMDESKLKFALGENKLVWNSSPVEGDLSRPLAAPKDFDHNSVYGLYLQGKNLISFRDYVKAEEKLKECLKKDPYYVPALTAIASLQLRRFEFEDGLATTRKALAVNTYDAAANYYYALVNLHLGNKDDTKDGFDIASQDQEYRTAAYVALAKLYLREQELSKAMAYAQKSLLTNQYCIDALQMLVVIHRLQKEPDQATKSINALNEIDPLNHFTAFEKYLGSGSAESKNNFVSGIRSEMPQQTYLELAIWYHQLGREEEAIQVLSMAANTPEVLYWQAFLQNKPVDLKGIQLANEFPFRDETHEVLKNLIKTNDHWLLKYHLALIEWNRGNISQAKNLFAQCGNEPPAASFYAARAALMQDNEAAAESDLTQAVKLDEKEWRYPKLLTEHFIAHKKFEYALSTIAPFYKSYPGNYIVGMLYARTLLLNSKFEACDVLLSSLKIVPFEGATIGRQLFQETKLRQAVSKMKLKHYKKALQFIASGASWPVNLGVGKPYAEDIDERLEDWLSYQCYTGMGQAGLANQSLQKIISFNPKVENTVPNFLAANHLVSAWAIEKASNRKSAEEWIQTQARLFPSNRIMQWSLSTFKSEQASLAPEEKDVAVRVLEQLIK